MRSLSTVRSKLPFEHMTAAEHIDRLGERGWQNTSA